MNSETHRKVKLVESWLNFETQREIERLGTWLNSGDPQREGRRVVVDLLGRLLSHSLEIKRLAHLIMSLEEIHQAFLVL